MSTTTIRRTAAAPRVTPHLFEALLEDLDTVLVDNGQGLEVWDHLPADSQHDPDCVPYSDGLEADDLVRLELAARIREGGTLRADSIRKAAREALQARLDEEAAALGPLLAAGA